MSEVVFKRFTVSNVIFYLDDRSYGELSEYLEDAKKHFHSISKDQKHYSEFEFTLSEFILSTFEKSEQIVNSRTIEAMKKEFGTFDKINDKEKNENVLFNNIKKGNAALGKSMNRGFNASNSVLPVLSILGFHF